MNKIGLWFWFSCKRQLKRPVYMLLLFLLPFALLGVQKAERADAGGISIALYTQEDGLAQDIVDLLVKESGMFQFYQCGSRQELEEDVASRRAECGYLFLEDLTEKLDKGAYRRSIEIYRAPSTVAAQLTTEVVFSRLYEVYGRLLLKQYLAEDGLFKNQDREEARLSIEDLYDQYYQDGSTFSFRYQTEANRTVPGTQKGRVPFPVRGIVAVYLFATGLFAAVLLCSDEKKGVYIPVPYVQKRWCALASMSAPVALSSVSGLAALWITGYLQGPHGIREIFIMSGYVLAVVVFSYLLKCLIRESAALCSLIPFFTIGSLVFCPVFFDLGAVIPAFRALEGIFLPYYYLMWF